MLDVDCGKLTMASMAGLLPVVSSFSPPERWVAAPVVVAAAAAVGGAAVADGRIAVVVGRRWRRHGQQNAG